MTPRCSPSIATTGTGPCVDSTTSTTPSRVARWASHHAVMHPFRPMQSKRSAAAQGSFDDVVVMAGYDEWWNSFPDSFDEVVDAARGKGCPQHHLADVSGRRRVQAAHRRARRRGVRQEQPDPAATRSPLASTPTCVLPSGIRTRSDRQWLDIRRWHSSDAGWCAGRCRLHRSMGRPRRGIAMPHAECAGRPDRPSLPEPRYPATDRRRQGPLRHMIRFSPAPSTAGRAAAGRPGRR